MTKFAAPVSVKYLAIFTGAILIIALSVALYFMFNNVEGHDKQLHWMVPIAIALMVVFMPLTAISFLSYRLPLKQKEYESVLKVLNLDAGGSQTEHFTDAEYRGTDYLLPVVFVVFFSLMGFYILFADNGTVLLQAMVWVEQDTDSTYSQIERQNLVAIGFSFLGSYVWSVQYLFRRLVTFDLPPGAYFSVGTRLVFSTFIVLVFSGAVGSKGLVVENLPMLAFLAGIFPERLLSWMRDKSGDLFSGSKDYASDVPLEMIEGISSFQRTRLSELGIDNTQNLAHANLVELIIKTPYKPRVIADWMAQARLCLEFKDNVNKIRRAGVRTILDFQEIAKQEGLLELVAEQSGLPVSLLRAIECTNRNEASIDRLRNAYDKLNEV